MLSVVEANSNSNLQVKPCVGGSNPSVPTNALIAQLDRASGYEPGGWGFESLWGYQKKMELPSVLYAQASWQNVQGPFESETSAGGIFEDSVFFSLIFREKTISLHKNDKGQGHTAANGPVVQTCWR